MTKEKDWRHKLLDVEAKLKAREQAESPNKVGITDLRGRKSYEDLPNGDHLVETPKIPVGRFSDALEAEIEEAKEAIRRDINEKLWAGPRPGVPVESGFSWATTTAANTTLTRDMVEKALKDDRYNAYIVSYANGANTSHQIKHMGIS